MRSSAPSGARCWSGPAPPCRHGRDRSPPIAGERAAAPPWQATLLGWGAAHRRDLPWRATRDPWAVLVSEVMLQQTQAARVVGPWREFLRRWPDPPSLAAAPLADVLAAWAGLGYPRRARWLHLAAAAAVERHDGRLPASLADLLALPGIGPYTARAVLAFAFEADVAVVDTNAGRVLARAVAGAPLRPAAAQRLADGLVPAGAAWAWNQSVLDLGATVCTARAPRCGRCPLAEWCTWGAGGWEAPDPAEGTAGASGRQAPFAGSDRQGRGRLLRAALAGPLPAGRLAEAAGWPGDPERAARVAEGLVADGLATWTVEGHLGPPGIA